MVADNIIGDLRRCCHSFRRPRIRCLSLSPIFWRQMVDAKLAERYNHKCSPWEWTCEHAQRTLLPLVRNAVPGSGDNYYLYKGDKRSIHGGNWGFEGPSWFCHRGTCSIAFPAATPESAGVSPRLSTEFIGYRLGRVSPYSVLDFPWLLKRIGETFPEIVSLVMALRSATRRMMRNVAMTCPSR